MQKHAQLGLDCEELALQYLECVQGFQLIARRVHFREGELDLVMAREGQIFFVEVKGRRSAEFGPVVESVTPQKYRRMRRAAQRWLDENGRKFPYDFLFVGIEMGPPLTIELHMLSED